LRISAIPCDSGIEIIQGVAKRTKRWLVVLPIDESAGAGLDGCRLPRASALGISRAALFELQVAT
jgi:hypothetical protein